MGAASRRKRLRRSLRLAESGQEETTKLSQRLIQIAQPYLDFGDDLDEYRKELLLASAAWNLSLFPPDLREVHMMNSLDSDAAGAEDRELMTEHVRELMRRKERSFPEDRRMIAKVEVIEEGEFIRVFVTSVI